MKRIEAPRHPSLARAADFLAAAEKAKARPSGKPRTPAEVDEVLDLILEHLVLSTDR